MAGGSEGSGMTEWRAVATGAAAGVAYLGFLAFLPGLRGLRWSAVPLVLATGLVAGVAAGLTAGGKPGDDATPADLRAGAWHGLLAGSLAGAVLAVAFVATLTTNTHLGVFYGLNYLLATSADRFPVVAERGGLVVAGLAGIGWGIVALLGLYGGRAAPQRESSGLIEE